MLADTMVAFVADRLSVVLPTELLALACTTATSAECGTVDA